MNVVIYGNSKGYPVLVFPTQDGTAFDYEKFEMIDVLSPYIEKGILQVFTVDSIDKETFSLEKEEEEKRLLLHDKYYHYIIDEVVPLIHQRNHSSVRILLTGNSMGGFHSTTFFLHRPDLFEGCLSLSGVYNAYYFFPGWKGEKARTYSPIHFLEDLPLDDYRNKLYQDRFVILCVGQGRWEEEGIESQRILSPMLEQHHIPCFIDYWGYDVDHDWYWWKKMILYLLPKALEQVKKHYPNKMNITSL